MALDPSIILSGQGVNALGALSAGNDAAARQNEYMRQRAYQNMLAQNGPGIMAGDQGALNALAGYDPAAALDVQNTRLNMDSTRQDMAWKQEDLAMRRAEAKQAAADKLAKEAAAMDAATLAAEKEKLNQTLSGAAYFYQRKDKAGYDAFLRGQGIDPAQYAFDMFPAYAAMGQGVMDAFEAFAPPKVDPMAGAPEGFMWTDPTNPAAGVAPIPGYAAKPADDYQRYVQEEQAAGRTPLSRLEFESAKKGQGVSVTTRNPDGSETIMSVGGAGGSGGPMKLTEQQSKDLVYWKRATNASGALDANESALVGLGDNLAGRVPVVGNYVVSEGYQLGNQAASEWLAAILRKDTGAAITKQEFDLYGPMFLPQPGDSAAVLEQKRNARKNAEEAIKAGLGTAEVLAVARGEVATPAPAAPAAPAPGGKKVYKWNPATGELE